MPEPKQLTLRNLFHTLGNKHYIAQLGSGVITDSLENILNNPNIPEECKEPLKNAIARLGKIEKAAEEADVLLDTIKIPVYEKLDVDEIKFDAAEIEKQLSEPKQMKRVF
jgi:hypothetical protein